MKDWTIGVRVAKKRAIISEVNGFIGRNMLHKKNIGPSYFALDFHPSTIADRQGGRDLITSTMKRQGVHASREPKKEIHPSPAVDEPEEELRILDQEINKDAIQSALDKP